ncbi:Hypothetical predicted protein [Paramuricea clavata]|uniref:Uncharacterized protein n=1 Tax=Paramuricea clavata TaxID=317549 RepID=A0A6S7JU26_PARCT|nr:Hypothetical predicted protein [Paramuricea clavata]
MTDSTNIVKRLEEIGCQGLSSFEVDRNKIKWRNDFEHLKKFVHDCLGINGKWSSPGGGAKRFKAQDDNFSINWYFKKQSTLLFQGCLGDVFKNKIIELLSEKTQKNGAVETVGDSVIQNQSQNEVISVSETTQESFLNTSDDISQNNPCKDSNICQKSQPTSTVCGCNCKSLATDIAGIQLDMIILQNRVEGMINAKTNISPNEEVMAKLQLELKQQQHRNQMLEDRVKAAEQERDSLLLALKLLTQDQRHSHEKQINANDRDDFQQPNRDTHAIPLKNQFSSLAVEETSESVSASTTNLENQSTRKRVKEEIVLIGDSIVKHIDPRKLTKKKVYKFTYPGKTAEDIEKELNIINIQSSPSHVIVHAGTNNIPIDSTKVCSKKLERLVIKTKAKFPNSKVGLSGITFRQDIEQATKIQEVNKKLEEMAAKHDVMFIDNSSIDHTCLNGSNIHLNGKGSAVLASHFITFLRGNQPRVVQDTTRSEKDFRMATINQIGDMLKAILVGNSRKIRR